MEFDEAKKCVSYLCPSANNDSQLQAKASLMVTTMSTIIQMVQYLQTSIEEDKQMGSINVGIYASASPPNNLNDTSGSRKFFALFGPLIVNDGVKNSAEDIDEVSLVPAQQESSNEENVILNTYTEPIQAAVGAIPVNNCFTVSDEIVTRCMSYVFDSSGFTIHPSVFKLRNIDNMNAKAVIKALKELFKHYKETLRCRGLNTNGLQYGRMIPAHLQNKTIFLPNLTLMRGENGQSFAKEGFLKLKLPIHKADRNKKTENIAILSTFLQHEGHGVGVEKVLDEFARNGYGTKGCQAFQKCTALQLRTSCRDKPKKVCPFFMTNNEHRLTVAEGVVDPFSTYIRGQKIPESAILIRISKLHLPMASLGDVFGCTNVSEIMELPIAWPKEKVGRKSILGERGNDDVIGDGIVVSMDLLYLEQPANEAMNISNAIILCDCTVREERKSDSYPFSEWYGNRLVRHMKDFLGVAPEEMGYVMNNAGGLMLWHRDRIG